MQEWSEKCDWCDAMPGEPCKTENGTILHFLVHRPRIIAYNKTHGFSPTIRLRLEKTLSLSQFQQIEGINSSVQKDGENKEMRDRSLKRNGYKRKRRKSRREA